jgi:hypothetical protein
MTKIEERAHFIAAAVRNQAMEVGAWNTESENGLIADIIQAQEEAALERVKPLLPLLRQHATEVRKCKLCPAMLAFVRTENMREMPIDLETGLPHFANCPNFRKRKEA